MPDLKKTGEGLKKLFASDKKQAVMVTLGLVGMLLILLSSFIGQGKGAASAGTTEITEAQTQYIAEQYAAGLEERLSGMVSEIQGVGRVRIMVTVENSGEYVYVQEEKRNVDRTTESGDGAGTTAYKENVEQSYILVDTDYGRKQALVKTRLEPKVQGVVIICEGADDAVVRQRLINVVTTALNIPSTRVCVEKIG